MTGKKKILSAARFYVVLDSDVADLDKLFVILKQTVAAGTKIVQLRCKQGSARDVLSFIKRALPVTRGKALVIVNDRVDLALVSHGDGVHLGQEDMPLKDARRMLGRDAIIGVSCQTMAQARLAQEQGADYIGFGSVFPTKTKPQRTGLALKIVSRIEQSIDIPVFWIGGITIDNVDRVINSGGQRVAVTRAICEAADVAASTRDFLKVSRG